MLSDAPAFASFSVDDLDAAERFYRDTLGLAVERLDMGILSVTPAGGTRVMLYPKPDHRAATFTVLNFEVPDVASAVERLTAAGVTMQRYDGEGGVTTDERGIAQDGGGPAIAWFTDPAGNILSVLETS